MERVSTETTAFQVRDAKSSDVGRITDLRLAFLEETGELPREQRAAVQQATADYFRRSLGRACITAVAEAERAIVATGAIVFLDRPPYPRNHLGREAFLIDVFTVPSHRGLGAGGAVLRHLLARAKDFGAKRIWLQASGPPRPMYEEAGFEPRDDMLELFL